MGEGSAHRANIGHAEDKRSDEFWTALDNELFPLVVDILAEPAKTRAGLAVQARAVSATCRRLGKTARSPSKAKGL
jgi:hypothetical protein